jgi:predicted O-linked N-acetylglucosamine transferase (SPINDLY family)
MPTISEALAIAVAHHQAGRLDLAEEIYRRVLAAEPNQADAWHLLGVIAHQTGNQERASECLLRAIDLDGGQAIYHNNLGNVLTKLGAWDEAVACYRRALELQPDYAQAHCNLGLALKHWRAFGEALACFRRAVELAPGDAKFHMALGAALKEHGALDEAIACYQRAVALQPAFAEAYNNLGNAYREQGKFDQAVAAFRRAIELKPDWAEMHNNLGNAYLAIGSPAEAATCLRRALQLKPDYAMAYNNLAIAIQRQGKVEDSTELLRRAVELAPDESTVRSSLLCELRYHPNVTLAELRDALLEFDRRHAAPLQNEWRAHENRRDPERPLVLGFVSPRFARGPLEALLARTLESLDPRACRIVCYSGIDDRDADSVTARFQAAAALWHNVGQWTDEQLAQQIREDRVDILFDLAGHSPHGRLLAFARKPAPIQITWLDSVGATGLSAMDYLLADERLIPAALETMYPERVLRLPDGYACYEPPADSPEVGPLPALKQGSVTFAGFHQLAKIRLPVVGVWSRVLHRVPGSRLVLKHEGFQADATRRDYQAWFAEFGVAPERLEFEGYTARDAYLRRYHTVDVALDPFPHGGGVTTCDALWMGVPVVTCPGETFASRQSLGHLSAVGFTETIASNLDEYVDIAVRLASDLPRLAGIRARLREQMAASPLCDGRRFAGNLMQLLRGVWREWCRKQS